MTTTATPLMILVAGPYRSGTDGDLALIRVNLEHMRRTALELYRRGHLPVLGEWFALPLIEEAELAGLEDGYEELFHPIAERVLERCDACLRIGGPSEGADRMVATAIRLGKPVYTDIAAIP
jgi:hypothetical protein